MDCKREMMVCKLHVIHFDGMYSFLERMTVLYWPLAFVAHCVDVIMRFTLCFWTVQNVRL